MEIRPTSLEDDEKYDAMLVREIISKEKNFFKIATWLSEKFSYRYGPDFSGRVDIKYNLIDKVFTVNCSDGSACVIDHNHLLELPAQLRVLRLRARRNKKEKAFLKN